jgi:hypothetical protein
VSEQSYHYKFSLPKGEEEDIAQVFEMLRMSLWPNQPFSSALTPGRSPPVIDGSGSFYGESTTSELPMKGVGAGFFMNPYNQPSQTRHSWCPAVPAEDELPVNLLLFQIRF